MKQILNIILVLSLLFSACDKELFQPAFDEGDGGKIYLAQAGEKMVPLIYTMNSEVNEFMLGIVQGGMSPVSQDVSAKLKADLSKVEDYNAENFTDYMPLPVNSFEIVGENVHIAAGNKNSDYIAVKIKTLGFLDPFVEYMLPISIVDLDADVPVNDKLRTAYYVVRAEPNMADFENYTKSGWSIAGFSTEEATGEGPNTGRAIHAIDGNDNTFWHSRWSGGFAPAPHSITIDMNMTQMVHGVQLLNRNQTGEWGRIGRGQPRTVRVEVSSDNVNFEQVGVLTDLNMGEGQALNRRFVPKFREARYVRVTITALYNEVFTAIAEINVF